MARFYPPRTSLPGSVIGLSPTSPPQLIFHAASPFHKPPSLLSAAFPQPEGVSPFTSAIALLILSCCRSFHTAPTSLSPPKAFSPRWMFIGGRSKDELPTASGLPPSPFSPQSRASLLSSSSSPINGEWWLSALSVPLPPLTLHRPATAGPSPPASELGPRTHTGPSASACPRTLCRVTGKRPVPPPESGLTSRLTLWPTTPFPSSRASPLPL